jgi:hypothetical protein
MVSFAAAFGIYLWRAFNRPPRGGLIVSVFLVVIFVVGAAVAAYLQSAGSVTAIFGAILQASLAVLAWWMGTGLSGNLNYAQAVSRFQVVLLVLLVIMPFGRFALPLGLIICLLYVFSLACVRWSDTLDPVSEVLRRPGARVLFGAAALVMVSALGLLLVVSPAAIRQAGAILSGLGGWLQLDRPQPVNAPPLDLRIACDLKPESGEAVLPESPSGEAVPINPVLVWVASGMILAALVWVVVVVAYRLRRRSVELKDAGGHLVEVSTGRVSLAGLLRVWLGLLRGLMISLRVHLRGWFMRSGEVPVPSSRSSRTVRECYRHLLAWASERGWPRAPAQTPVEYARVLSQAFPDLREEMDFITGAYLQARYRNNWQEIRELAEVRKAWEKLRLAPRKRGREAGRLAPDDKPKSGV